MPAPVLPISVRTEAATPITRVAGTGVALLANGATPHDIESILELHTWWNSADARTKAAAGTIIFNDAAAGGGTDIVQADVTKWLANMVIAQSVGGSGGDGHTMMGSDASGHFQAAGGQLQGLVAGTATGHAVEFDQLQAVIAGLKPKGSVKALSALPIGTLSGLPGNIDDIAIADQDLVLLAAEGVKEETTILAVADSSGSLDGLYFFYSTIDTDYYVWFDVDAGGNDPAVVGRTGIQVSIATDDANTVVGAAIQSAMDGVADIDATLATATTTAIPTKAGNTTNGSTETSTMTVTTTVAGTGGLAAGHVNNGIWIVETGGAWTRPANFLTGADAAAAHLFVQQGTLYAEQQWLCLNDTGSAVVDTDALVWDFYPIGGTGATGFRKEFHWGSNGSKVPNNAEPFLLAHSDGLRGDELEQLRLRDGQVTGLGVEVDAADATRGYDIEVYVEGNLAAPIATLSLSNSLEAFTTALTAAYNAGDSISIGVKRTSGTGKSTFIHVSVTIELTETA